MGCVKAGLGKTASLISTIMLTITPLIIDPIQVYNYDDKMAKLNGTPWKKPVWATRI